MTGKIIASRRNAKGVVNDRVSKFFAKFSCGVLLLFVSLCAMQAVAQDAPTIANQPQDIITQFSNSVSFAASATGTDPLSYQWYHNYFPAIESSHVVGTTNATLSINSVISSDSGTYYLVVSNAFGTVSSSNATLQIIPIITAQPAPRSAPLTANTIFNVTASGSAPLYYRWQLNGTDVPGATASTFTVTNIQSANLGTYTVTVTNSAGWITSSNAVLAAGPVACWGLNDKGQCLPPIDLGNRGGVYSISGGLTASGSLLANGQVAVWGNFRVPPVATDAVAFVENLEAAGTTDGSALLHADGTVTPYPTPFLPPGVSNAIAVARTPVSTICLRRNGTVYDPDLPNLNLAHVKALSVGYSQNMALREDGTVFVWTRVKGSTTTNVPGYVHNIMSIASGYTHCLALNSAGRVLAWGSGAGTNIPALLTSDSAPRVAAIAAGNGPVSCSFALLTNGTVLAWGDDSYGQIDVPPTLTNVVAIGSGWDHSLALVSDGRPLFFQPPVGGIAYYGRDFTLAATVNGTAPLFYQWSLNGTNLVNATNSILVLNNVQPSDAGSYQLVVTNALGSATSVPAPVNVVESPLFLSVQPTSHTNWVGTKINMGIPINGSGPVQIQWRFANSTNSGGTPIWQNIPGATNEDLVVDPIRSADAGTYSVLATNAFGSITSSNATLAVRQVAVWGDNSYGQTNVPNVTNAVATVPVNQFGLCTVLLANGNRFFWPGTPVTNKWPWTNLVEVTSDFGLRTDGTVMPFYTLQPALAAVISNLTHILAIQSDGSELTFLQPDGSVTRYDFYGRFVGAATNVIAMFDEGGSLLYADGSSSTPFYRSTLPNFTNSISFAHSYYSAVGLRPDGSLEVVSNSPPAGSNFIAVAATHYETQAAVSADGTVTNFGALNPKLSAVPADLAKVWTIEGGDYNYITISSTNEPPIFLSTALDTPSIVVSSKNSAQWYGQTHVTHDGLHAARSAAIEKNTASSMRMLTNGPVKVSFWWKVSSETNHDYLTFSIGGVPQAAISGEVDWQQVTFDVPAGPQMLVWTYSKDATGTAGLDAGFVDQLTFTPIAPSIVTQPVNTTVIGPAPAGLSVTATGTPPLKYQWFSTTGTNILSTSSALIYKPSTRASSGTYFVIVSNMVSAVQSSNATLTVHVPQKIGYPLLQPDGTFLITSQDSDASTFSTNFDPSVLQAEYSSNLIDWFPLSSSLTITNGLLHLNDSDSSNAPFRFYRILEQY